MKRHVGPQPLTSKPVFTTNVRRETPAARGGRLTSGSAAPYRDPLVGLARVPTLAGQLPGTCTRARAALSPRNETGQLTTSHSRVSRRTHTCPRIGSGMLWPRFRILARHQYTRPCEPTPLSTSSPELAPQIRSQPFGEEQYSIALGQ